MIEEITDKHRRLLQIRIHFPGKHVVSSCPYKKKSQKQTNLLLFFFQFALKLLLFESLVCLFDQIKKIEIQLTSVIFDLKIDIEREKNSWQTNAPMP